jgi:hypothetical protein
LDSIRQMYGIMGDSPIGAVSFQMGNRDAERAAHGLEKALADFEVCARECVTELRAFAGSPAASGDFDALVMRVKVLSRCVEAARFAVEPVL